MLVFFKMVSVVFTYFCSFFSVSWTVYRLKEDNTQMFGDSITKIYTFEEFNDAFLLHKILSVITNTFFIVYCFYGKWMMTGRTWEEFK